MQEFYHEESLVHFADIQAICLSLSVESKLCVVDEDWTQLTHSEVLTTQVLKLNEGFFRLIISADLVNENASAL